MTLIEWQNLQEAFVLSYGLFIEWIFVFYLLASLIISTVWLFVPKAPGYFGSADLSE